RLFGSCRSSPRPTVEQIEQYRGERLSSAKAPATVRQDLAALSDCLKWAVKLKYLHTNPAKEVERPSLPVKQADPAAYMTPEEFGDFIAEARKDRPLYKFAVSVVRGTAAPGTTARRASTAGRW